MEYDGDKKLGKESDKSCKFCSFLFFVIISKGPEGGSYMNEQSNSWQKVELGTQQHLLKLILKRCFSYETISEPTVRTWEGTAATTKIFISTPFKHCKYTNFY